MVAPNGARRTHADHPALPVTIDETVETAIACQRVGADGIHAHVRDSDAKHILDAGLYKELISELTIKAPELHVQITTEAVGMYSPKMQRQLVYDVQPQRVSVALTEMTADGDAAAAREFYHSCHQAGTGLQHILYSVDDLKALQQLVKDGTVPTDDLQLLFVLGRYSENQQSRPSDIQPFLDQLKVSGLTADWGLCAFGQQETDCLVAAESSGGHMRIGFENSLWHSDGRIAKDNAERISELLEALRNKR